MSGGWEWFAPKRYGYGIGAPIAWQGWLTLAVYLATIVGAAIILRDHKLQVVAIAIPVTAVFLVIAARTTRGGWRWRWGNEG